MRAICEVLPVGQDFFMKTGMKFKAELMNREEVMRALKRMAHQISEKNSGCDNLVLLGIKTRGIPLAKLLADFLMQIEGSKVPVGELDITLYRDDLSEIERDPVVSPPKLDFSVEGRIVVLVDDVIYTGRTARAALDAVSSMGRAARIQLAALVDRGHRELPIRPDFVGKNVPTARYEVVSVMLDETDGKTSVNLYSRK